MERTVDIETVWYWHHVDGVPVALLTGKLVGDCWLRGIEQPNGQVWKDPDHSYESEADALAAAYRCWQERGAKRRHA
jgi:hypothetical protein